MQFHGAKLYGETGTRMAKVTMVVKVAKDAAAEKFGSDFDRVAFGAMVVKDQDVSFPCGVMSKPNLTVEMHDVELLGHTVRVALEVPKITPVDGEQIVAVSLVLPLEVTKKGKGMFGDLTCASGDVVEAKFDPVQMDLPNTEGMTVKRKDGAFGNPQPQLVS
jgi:hypothetical protein